MPFPARGEVPDARRTPPRPNQDVPAHESRTPCRPWPAACHSARTRRPRANAYPAAIRRRCSAEAAVSRSSMKPSGLPVLIEPPDAHGHGPSVGREQRATVRSVPRRVPPPPLAARREIPEPESPGLEIDHRQGLPVGRERDPPRGRDHPRSGVGVVDLPDHPPCGRVPDTDDAGIVDRDQGLAIRGVEDLVEGITVVESAAAQPRASMLGQRVVGAAERRRLRRPIASGPHAMADRYARISQKSGDGLAFGVIRSPQSSSSRTR